MTSLRELIRGDELIVAPCALNPIMARIAEDAGFKAVYMSGGSLGWLKCVTEANLTLPELAEIAVAGVAEGIDLDWFEYVPGYRTPAGTGTGMSFATWG